MYIYNYYSISLQMGVVVRMYLFITLAAKHSRKVMVIILYVCLEVDYGQCKPIVHL